MRRLLLTCAGFLTLANVLCANPACTSNTIAYYMANYVDQNTACQVGDKLFFGFNYSGTSQGSTAPTSTEVNVVGDPSDPNEPGLLFSSSGWTVSGGQRPFR